MSAAVYAEPYKLPAGALALAVHGAFFALLYFGVSWQTQPPQGMVVDIWDSLPEMKSAPAKVVSPEVVQVEPPKPPEPSKLVEPPKLAEPIPPVAPPKADIELAEKKKPKAKPVEIKKPVELKNPPVGQKKITEAEKAQQAVQAEQGRVQAEQAAQVEQDRAHAEAARGAAITNEVGKYKGLIEAKIRRNVVEPDVAENAQAEFEVTLLPDGEVLGDPKLVKSSGNAAYDSAVERAILKAQPLPLPPDVALFNRFRELHLTIRPKKRE